MSKSCLVRLVSKIIDRWSSSRLTGGWKLMNLLGTSSPAGPGRAARAGGRGRGGIGMRHVAFERLPDGDLQFDGAVAVQQLKPARGDGAEVGPALGGSQE